jgi:ornithine carbamoyltransferase
MKNLLSLESLAPEEILRILELAAELKATRGRHAAHPLRHRCWGMIFQKSSTRTRVSFEVGIRELGGDAIFLNANDLQLGSRGEPMQDTARVLGRMLHGAVIRTYAQSDLELFAQASGLPTVNALTDQEHPCQILADLLTIQEALGSWRGKTVCYVGDGACNVPASWLWAAAKLDFRLVIAAPSRYQPAAGLLARLGPPADVRCEPDAARAAEGADVLYTDVWVSMGMEAEAAQRIEDLAGYQINAALLERAAPGALVMHCLPAYRGKEITAEVLEAHAGTIFTQAENRLHVQKAVLSLLAENQAD